MSRRIEIDAASGEVVVSFRFDRALKDTVKAISGSRFHGHSKTWRFPGERLPDVVATLQPLGFACPELPDRAARLPEAAREARAPHAPYAAPPLAQSADDTLRIRDLNLAIQGVLKQRFQQAFWVVGELANYDKNRAGGHAWFELVDVDPAQGQQGSGEVMRAVAFASARQRMVRKMDAEGLSLADGLTVRMRVRVEFYVPRGSIQLQIEDIDVGWSAGALALRREQVVRAIAERGLATRQPNMPLSRTPLRVALVTSFESDAYHDVLSGLRASKLAFQVTPFDVRVQGDGLSASVCAALAWIARHPARFDIVLITRGGGSRVELGAWDDLPVALAVAELPLKVWVAIGHQQDRCALDEIAESAKTPTEAAERLVSRVQEALERAEGAAEGIGSAVSERIARVQNHTNIIATRLAHRTRQNLGQERVTLDSTLPRLLAKAATNALARRRASLHAASARLSPGQLARPTQHRAEQLRRLEQRLLRAAPNALRDARRELDHAAQTLKLVHPDNILRRGFAILRDTQGRPIVDSHKIRSGDPLTVQTAHHEIGVSVTKLLPRTPREGAGDNHPDPTTPHD